jgi:hypothetical protein
MQSRSDCVFFSSPGKTDVIGQGTAPVLVPMTSHTLNWHFGGDGERWDVGVLGAAANDVILAFWGGGE